MPHNSPDLRGSSGGGQTDGRTWDSSDGRTWEKRDPGVATEYRAERATHLGLPRAVEQAGTSSRRGNLVRSSGESWCLGLHHLGVGVIVLFLGLACPPRLVS